MAGRTRRRMMRRMMRRNPVASSTMEAFQNAFTRGQVTLPLSEMPNRFETDFQPLEEAQIDERIKAQGVTPTNDLVDRLGLVAYTLDQGDSQQALRSMIRMAQLIKSEEEAKAFMAQVDSILSGSGFVDSVDRDLPALTAGSSPKPALKPSAEEEDDEFGVDTVVSVQEVKRTPTSRGAVGSKLSNNRAYELSNSELVRLAIYRRSNARQRETYGKFFLFLQFGKRTKPIPSVDVWIKAIDAWGSNNKPLISSTPMLGEVFESVNYQNPALRQNLFVLYRPYRKGAPTQFYVPSLNGTYSNDGKNRIVFSPAAEFISRTDIVPGSILPNDLKKAYLGYTEDERTSGDIIRIGKLNEPESMSSIYQMAEAIGLMQSNKPWRKRREKYQAYGVFYFEEDSKGKIQMRKYFDPPRPSLMPTSTGPVILSDEQLTQLPNPRRNRRRTRRLVRRPRRR